jgi:hypothetical protein
MKRSGALVALILAAVAVAACNAPAATRLPTSASIETPAALRGTWTADVRGTSASSGAWKLTITDTNFALQNPVGGDPFTLDPTAVTETSVAFPADEGCPDQTTVTEGRYTMALTGNTLVFTLVSDSCGDRSATLTTTPWVRTP